MASFRLNFTLMICTLALVAGALFAGFAFNAAALAQETEQSDPPRKSRAANSDAAEDRQSRVKNRKIRFSRGTAKDLYAARMAETMHRIEKSPGVEDQTKVWIAYADVASLPGLETIVHVKSPISCGSLGCELVIMGDINGQKTVLLRTICETIRSLSQDKLIINEGSRHEMIWVFDGAKFVQNK